LATGDVQISTDGGAFTNLGTLPTVTPAAGGTVEVNLTSGEVGNDHFTVKFSDQAGAEWKETYYHETVADQNAIIDIPTLVDAVWDEPQAGHVTADTFGYYLDARVSEATGASILNGELVMVVDDSESVFLSMVVE